MCFDHIPSQFVPDPTLTGVLFAKEDFFSPQRSFDVFSSLCRVEDSWSLCRVEDSWSFLVSECLLVSSLLCSWLGSYGGETIAILSDISKEKN